MKNQQSGKCNFIKYGIHFLIMLYTISSVFLYYKQTQWTGGAVYESDLPAHIKMIIEDGWYYSLTAFVYKACYAWGDGSLAIAGFLGICTNVAVYLTYCLLKKIRGRITGDSVMSSKWDNIMLLCALLLNFVMPCYVRGLSDGRYIGMQSANIWHNSTYIAMKPMALLCIILYMELMEQYVQETNWKKLIGFSVALVICTAIKPSFLVAFAPTMAVFLVIDLLQGIPFRKVFLFGLTVVPSLVVILLQNAILFGGTTGNGWEIKPGYALSMHSGHPIIVAALSILFPLMVFARNMKKVKTDKWFSFVWLMALIAFAEVFLLCESGERAGDGNFMWGYSFAILILFVLSILVWLSNVNRDVSRTKICAQKIMYRLYEGTTMLVLLYHIYCGLYFYLNLLQGVSYYMWD